MTLHKLSTIKYRARFCVLLIAGTLLTACGARNEVIIYTALDQIYSEPILRRFEERTGIEVRAVYDSEAAKTTGLVSRLFAERERPRCDVFWNNEVARTIWLRNEGLLEPYSSPNAEAIPEAYKDPQGYWTGFAARVRVLVYNTELISREELPGSLEDLTDDRWRGKLAMAYPLFGTTATHVAVLYASWGEAKARAFLQSLKDGGVQIMEGNMSVCRAVADGEFPLGLTDTDDAHLLKSQGKAIDWVLIDHGGEGALLIPNTLALIKDGPNPEQGRMLVDYLLSREVEEILAASPSAQIPLHPLAEVPPVVEAMRNSAYFSADYARAADFLQPSADFLKTLFARP